MNRYQQYQQYLNIFAWIIFIALLIFFIYQRNRVGTTLSVTSNAYCSTCSIVESLPSTNLILNTVGVKKALLIGLNYSFPGSACIQYDCELFGCIQDAKNIMSLLLSNGYLRSNIKLLLDDGSTEMPTREVIIRELNSIIDSMNSGDTSFVWYSGHGAQKNNYSSIDNGFNECWCPPDTIINSNYITDDEINAIIKKAPNNSTVFIGSDSCHSATVLDLKYIAVSDNMNETNRIAQIRGRHSISSSTSSSVQFSSNKDVSKNFIVGGGHRLTNGSKYKVLDDSEFTETSSFIVSLSGCQDYDTSSDAFLSGKSQGAMSWAFCTSFSNSMTLSDLLTNMRQLLKNTGFSQIPQLTFGKLINPDITTLREIMCP